MEQLDYVSEMDFNSKVLQSESPVLVDFYADWCAPCKLLTPLLEEMARDYEGRLSIVKMDVDGADRVPGFYGVQSLPTLIFFRNGRPEHRLVGALPKSVLKAQVEKLLTTVPA